MSDIISSHFSPAEAWLGCLGFYTSALARGTGRRAGVWRNRAPWRRSCWSCLGRLRPTASRPSPPCFAGVGLGPWRGAVATLRVATFAPTLGPSRGRSSQCSTAVLPRSTPRAGLCGARSAHLGFGFFEARPCGLELDFGFCHGGTTVMGLPPGRATPWSGVARPGRAAEPSSCGLQPNNTMAMM